MARFRYQCLDANASEWKGVLDSTSVESAIQTLRDLGVYPTEVTECDAATPVQLCGLPHSTPSSASHVLGTCPTCDGKVALSAKSCPHCGEVEFKATQEVEVNCTSCNATGRVSKWLSAHPCPDCTDGRRITLERIDLRTSP